MLKKLFYLLFAALIFVGCSDDEEDNPTGPGNGNGDVPQLNLKTAQLPDAMMQNQDPMAQQVTAWVQAINAMSNALVVPAAGTSQTGDNTWQWKDDGVTVTYKVTTSGNTRSYTVHLNGTDSDGDTFDNFLLMNGQASTDGKSGSLTYYPYSAEDGQMNYEWSTNDAGVTTINYTSDYDRIVFTSNADKSGQMLYYSSETGNEYLASKYTWNAAGAGQWWMYDDSGNETASGSWN